MTSSWKEFWNRKNRIYVSERHLNAYYEGLIRGLKRLLPQKRPLELLDYGCGEARGAAKLAGDGVRIRLYDAVPYMRERAKEHVHGIDEARVLEDEEFAALAPESFDVIFVYSVLQYLPKEEFQTLLARFHVLLRQGGMLILGDVVPPHVSMLADVRDLLSAGLKHGFLVRAVMSLALTFFSEYRGIRKTNGFTTYEEREMLDLLKAVGFNAQREAKNIGFGRERMLFISTRP
jgi:SAM-dependent methyltransferase